MKIPEAYEAALRFLVRYERPLSALLFLGGFITDLLTFGLMRLRDVTLLFTGYLAFVIVVTLVAHRLHGRTETKFVRAVAAMAPLAAQFVFGGLLSGFLIFYTKSAVLFVSWPFILLLFLIFIGNELFRTYSSHLVFQTILLYFSLYAFAIFALPFFIGHLGKELFFLSTAAALAAIALYAAALYALQRERLTEAFRTMILSIAGVTAIIVPAYLAGFIPPIPLTLKAGGIYHSIEHTGEGYTLVGEGARPWYDPRPQLVHHVPGTPLYAFSAIFAPGKFTSGVLHEWQYYDPKTEKWETRSTVAFTLSGGREGGYRGYSLKSDPEPGHWRVRVLTQTGQTIGEFRFDVQKASSEPSLQTKRL